MRLVLKQETKLYVLENHISLILDDNTYDKVRTKYQRHLNDD
jgi:hypothetical protein